MALRGEWTTARERGRALVARPAHPPLLPVLARVEPVGDSADDLAHAEIRPRGARFELTLLLVTDLVALVALCSVARSLTLTAVTSAVAVATWRARGLYSHRISLSVLDDLPELGVGVLVGLAPGLAAALMVPTGLVGATAALQVATAVLGAVALGRFASYGVILRLRARGAVSYPTVLITSGGAADSLVDRIATHPESGLRIVGTIANQGGRTRGLPLLGPSADLSAIVREQHISNVVIGYGGISSGDLVDVLRRADWANLEIHVVPRLFELSTRRGTDDHIWGLPLVRLRAPARRVMARRTKRAFDLVGATLALVLTAPLDARRGVGRPVLAGPEHHLHADQDRCARAPVRADEVPLHRLRHRRRSGRVVGAADKIGASAASSAATPSTSCRSSSTCWPAT